MGSPSRRREVLFAAAVLGIFPCILGIAVGLYLRWSGTVWLTNTGGFWPIACFVISLAILTKRAISPFEENTARVGAWLMVTWTWLYFPLWLMATEIPKSSGVVSRHGQVSVANEWVKLPSDRVWLLTGLGGSRIVRNVAGTVTVNSVDIEYRYDDQYIAARGNGEDLLEPIARAATAILAVEAGKPRSSRIRLFEKAEARDRLIARICGAVVADRKDCPMRLSLSPRSDATVLGAVWSKHFTEEEAIGEGDLPALAQLLTQDDVHLVDRDGVFARFMSLAVSGDELAKVGKRPRMLSAHQFDELIKRILDAPGTGDESAIILTEVNRLNRGQRQALRAKVLREASIKQIIERIARLHVTDAELLQLAVRMSSAFENDPDVAVLALKAFGQRLPPHVQHDAVRAIVEARGSHALAVFPFMNFSEALRQRILNKILSDASVDDFNAAALSRQKLEGMLTPTEMRLLIASVVKKSEYSTKWLDFAIRALPVREMTPAERKSILTGRLFESAKSALEFVSENRRYLESGDVNDVTHQYTRTIMPDMCLHLSHRNKNRGIAYFSDTQLQIFRDCAQSK